MAAMLERGALRKLRTSTMPTIVIEIMIEITCGVWSRTMQGLRGRVRHTAGSIEWSYPEPPVNLPTTRDLLAGLNESTSVSVRLRLDQCRKQAELLNSLSCVCDCRRISTYVAREPRYSPRERRGMRRVQYKLSSAHWCSSRYFEIPEQQSTIAAF